MDYGLDRMRTSLNHLCMVVHHILIRWARYRPFLGSIPKFERSNLDPIAILRYPTALGFIKQTEYFKDIHVPYLLFGDAAAEENIRMRLGLTAGTANGTDHDSRLFLRSSRVDSLLDCIQTERGLDAKALVLPGWGSQPGFQRQTFDSFV